MSGWFRELVPLLLGLGALKFAALAVPLLFAGAGFARGSHVASWHDDALTWVLIVATGVTLFISIDALAETQQVCDQLREGMRLEQVLPNLVGPSTTQEYIDKCG